MEAAFFSEMLSAIYKSSGVIPEDLSIPRRTMAGCWKLKLHVP
jgi:hypothetical protein